MAKIIPVIHFQNSYQAEQNIKTVLECGLNQIFLIKHWGDTHEVIALGNRFKQQYPNLWIGINILGMPTVDALQQEFKGIDGLWCDDGLECSDVDTLYKVWMKRKFKGLFFGGLQFKYQKRNPDTFEACVLSRKITDVSCTSGTQTGQAPTLTKIKTLYHYLNYNPDITGNDLNHPLAIASGIDAGNIKQFLPYVNYFLVATSITEPKEELIIKEKLQELIKQLEN